MAAFPIDPRFTKAILSAVNLGCTEEVITIVAMLSGDSPIVTPPGKKIVNNRSFHLSCSNFYLR